MISREMLEEMFGGMRNNSKWNVDAPLLGGFFFTADDEAGLRKAADRLVQDGYTFVDIWEADGENEEPPAWWLHVERVEYHTVDSLLARNDVLYAFAASNAFRSYDGMDVGPAPPQ